MVRAYLFDMDGTIVDNMSVHLNIWIEFMASLGVHVPPAEMERSTIGKINAEIFRELLDPSLSDAQVLDLSRRKEALYRERFKPLLKETPGLTAFLRQARAGGKKLAVATAANRDNTDFVLEGLGITAYFDALVTSEDITRGKPDPEVFLIAAARLGVAARDCLVFEDSPAGLEAAFRAGMSAVALHTTFPESQLVNLPGVLRVISDFTAVMPAI